MIGTVRQVINGTVPANKSCLGHRCDRVRRVRQPDLWNQCHRIVAIFDGLRRLQGRFRGICKNPGHSCVIRRTPVSLWRHLDFSRIDDCRFCRKGQGWQKDWRGVVFVDEGCVLCRFCIARYSCPNPLQLGRHAFFGKKTCCGLRCGLRCGLGRGGLRQGRRWGRLGLHCRAGAQDHGIVFHPCLDAAVAGPLGNAVQHGCIWRWRFGTEIPVIRRKVTKVFGNRLHRVERVIEALQRAGERAIAYRQDLTRTGHRMLAFFSNHTRYLLALACPIEWTDGGNLKDRSWP